MRLLPRVGWKGTPASMVGAVGSRWPISFAWRRHRGCLPLEATEPTADNSQIEHIIQSTQRRLRSLYLKTGRNSYIGKSVSICEHSVQAAIAAARDGADDDLVLACLLHEVGTLLCLESGSAPGRNPIPFPVESFVEHERFGAEFLGAVGFSDDVCWMVRRHADAMRYLCTVEPDYMAKLSPAGKFMLECHGGAMPAHQCAVLEGENVLLGGQPPAPMHNCSHAQLLPRTTAPTHNCSPRTTAPTHNCSHAAHLFDRQASKHGMLLGV